MGKPKKDLTDQQIYDWKVIKYLGNSTWSCQCSCGKIKDVRAQYLIDGRSRSCGHNTTGFKDLTGMQFRDWKVLKYNGDQKWLCRCTCGTERSVESYFLTSGKSKSCGHNTNKAAFIEIDRTFQDLAGKQFGDWEVLGYKGNSQWNCKCSCGTIRSVHRYTLTSGTSKSCGHIIDTDSEGKVTGLRIVKKPTGRVAGENKLTKEDIIRAIQDYINKYGDKPFIKDLFNLLDRGGTAVRRYIKEYNLYEYINQSYRSRAERDIALKFKGAIIPDRATIKPYELDIHVPQKRLAIEFNGIYWHSDDQKDKYYHQRKTIACAKKGIRLIHIFEHEWEDTKTHDKLDKFLDYLNSGIYTTIHGDNTKTYEIDNKDASEFLDKYHLEGTESASIYLGCYYNNELMGVMTLRKLGNNMQYEIVRLGFKQNIRVTDGPKKIYNYFIKMYNPEYVIVHCNIAKFTGNVHTKIRNHRT